MDLQEAVSFGIRVARRMSKDPEVESIGAVRAWRALQDFDPSQSSIEQRITHMVKQGVWCYWRKMRVRKVVSVQMPITPEGDQIDVAAPEVDTDTPLEPWVRELLCNYYIDRWPLDVVAKRYNRSVHQVRKLLADARMRFFVSLH